MEKSKIVKFYTSLLRIRRVEEEIARIYPSDKIKSPVHLSIGQEAISVGVCEALSSQDVVFGTYRGHALYLAKGGDLNKMIAELYGKVTGCCGGKGGSMHLMDIDSGVMGQSAIVATTIPQAVGFAFAQQYLKTKRVTVCFFGDGAVEEGVFHESMNFASLKKLPIIFICENNQLAIHSHQKNRQGFKSITQLVKAYSIQSEKIANGNVFTIYSKVKKAVDEIRNNFSGPRFFECMTYRLKEHVGPNEDFSVGYRSEKEAQNWRKKDQVKKLALTLDPITREKIEVKIETEIKEATLFAEKSPFPKAEELYKFVFRENI